MISIFVIATVELLQKEKKSQLSPGGTEFLRTEMQNANPAKSTMNNSAL